MNRLFKKFLATRRMEYLTLDQDLLILKTSGNVERFAEFSEGVLPGKDVRFGFPELIGSEESLRAILEGDQDSFEFNAIARASDSDSPLYFNLYAIKLDKKSATNQLIIFFEETTQKMILEQQLVQSTNETGLLMSALAASHQYIDKIIASIADALLVTNQSGEIKKVNQAALNLFKYSEEEIISSPISKIIKDEKFLLRTWQQHPLLDDFLKNVEVGCKTKLGDKVDVAFSCSTIQTEIEGLHDFVYIGRDITEQKRAQRRQAAQYATTRVLSESVTLKQASQIILPALCESLGWDLGELWIPEEDEKQNFTNQKKSKKSAAKFLKCVEVWHRPFVTIPEFLSRTWQTKFRPGVGLPGRVWKTRSTHWISDVMYTTHSQQADFKEGMHGSFGFPILGETEVLGVMTFFSREVQQPDEDLLQMMGAIGSQIGQFIQRKQAEAALQKITQLQQAILDSANFSIISTDPDGVILTFNLAAQQWLGYTVEQVVGKANLTLMHDSAELANRTQVLSQELDRQVEPGFEAVVAKTRQGGADEHEWTYISKESDRFPVRVSVTALHDATGEIKGFLCMGRNLSEYKQTIQALRQREKLLDLAGDSILIRDVNDNIVYWNQGAERLYGWTRQEILGKQTHSVLQTIFPQSLEMIQQLLLREGYWQGELVHLKRDGTPLIVASRWTLQRTSDGNLSACLEINTDITERKQMQRALQESEERYRDLFENANDLIQSVTPDGHFLYVNRAWRETLGYSEVEVASLTILDIIHLNSQAHYRQLFQRAMLGEKLDECGADFVTKDGRKISVEGSISCKFVDERPVAIRAIFRDITERLQAEEALRQQQQQTERLLLNVLPEPIAKRLKQEERTIAENFNEVTVLFADIVGFTELSSRTSPTELVEMLNVIFSDFDQLAELHNLEKIKTIGDAYMVVGGLPKPQLNHAQAIAEMALDMQTAIAQFCQETGEAFSIRIGINTGSVVAGVIGKKKFIYDLWGDAVNIASRMESHGLPGRIQVTEQTYERLQGQYVFEERGAIQVKGKGLMNTYFLIAKKDEFIE